MRSTTDFASELRIEQSTAESESVSEHEVKVHPVLHRWAVWRKWRRRGRCVCGTNCLKEAFDCSRTKQYFVGSMDDDMAMFEAEIEEAERAADG